MRSLYDCAECKKSPKKFSDKLKRHEYFVLPLIVQYSIPLYTVQLLGLYGILIN